MKNATKHADTLKSLSRKLVREYKPAPRQPQEPLPALVHRRVQREVQRRRRGDGGELGVGGVRGTQPDVVPDGSGDQHRALIASIS